MGAVAFYHSPGRGPPYGATRKETRVRTVHIREGAVYPHSHLVFWKLRKRGKNPGDT